MEKSQINLKKLILKKCIIWHPYFKPLDIKGLHQKQLKHPPLGQLQPLTYYIFRGQPTEAAARATDE